MKINNHNNDNILYMNIINHNNDNIAHLNQINHDSDNLGLYENKQPYCSDNIHEHD